MALCLVCKDDQFVEKTFILDNRFVHFSGIKDPSTGSYMVEIRNLYTDGSETKTTKEFTRAKLNRTLTSLSNIDSNSGSICKLMQTLRVNPNKFFYYGVNPSDL